VSLEFFQQEWERPRIEIGAVPVDATFRLEVDQRMLRLAPPWLPQSGTAHYIRPNMTSTHYDFLMMVVPEDFRAATIYPCCINLLEVVQFVTEKISSAQQAQRESRAKREVERALRFFGAIVPK
jgi:hypothetical protein